MALTLRLLGGLPPTIARAFLVPEPTIAQRIVRARDARQAARAATKCRAGPRAERLSSVSRSSTSMFNEGDSATSGDDWYARRSARRRCASSRARGLAPEEPEVHGLAALMELQASRLRARVGPSGEAVRLADQNRARWDRLLIGRGPGGAARAEQLGGGRRPTAAGRRSPRATREPPAWRRRTGRASPRCTVAVRGDAARRGAAEPCGGGRDGRRARWPA